MIGCEFVCSHCDVKMTSLSNGITWCPNCGKVTSVFAPVMFPEMSKMIFEAKKSVGEKVPDGFLKVSWGPPEMCKPVLKVVPAE